LVVWAAVVAFCLHVCACVKTTIFPAVSGLHGISGLEASVGFMFINYGLDGPRRKWGDIIKMDSR
jgi:hypothetical protein